MYFRMSHTKTGLYTMTPVRKRGNHERKRKVSFKQGDEMLLLLFACLVKYFQMELRFFSF